MWEDAVDVTPVIRMVLRHARERDRAYTALPVGEVKLVAFSYGGIACIIICALEQSENLYICHHGDFGDFTVIRGRKRRSNPAVSKNEINV